MKKIRNSGTINTAILHRVGRKRAPRHTWQRLGAFSLPRGWRPTRLPTSLHCTEQPLIKGVSEPRGQQCPGWETLRSIGNSFAYANMVKNKTWAPFCSFFKKSLSYSKPRVTSGSFQNASFPRSLPVLTVLQWPLSHTAVTCGLFSTPPTGLWVHQLGKTRLSLLCILYHAVSIW